MPPFVQQERLKLKTVQTRRPVKNPKAVHSANTAQAAGRANSVLAVHSAQAAGRSKSVQTGRAPRCTLAAQQSSPRAFLCACMAAFCLAAALCLVACNAMPGTGGTGAVHEMTETAAQAVIDARTQQIQNSIQAAADLAGELSAIENKIENACSVADNPNFYAELDELQASHTEKLEQGQTLVADARKQVDAGIAWVEGVAAESEEAAQATEHFMRQLNQARTGLAEMAELMNYEQRQLTARTALGNPPENPELGSVGDYYTAVWAAYGAYDAISAPQCMEDLNARFAELWEMAGTYYYNMSEAGASHELDRRSLIQMMDWVAAREKLTLKQQSWVAGKQYDYVIDMMADRIDPEAAPEVEFHAIERVSPNLYDSLDSVLDLTVCATHEQDVIIEVEIAGLTLTHTTKLTLQPGVNYFELKPELLPSLTVADLESASTTQLNYRMTSPDGTMVDAQSASVEVLTIYDYLWYNDNFGFAAQYELFAWLRPGHAVIDDLVRRAADYVGDWTDGEFREINGYQYGADWYGTLLQVAAIQKAMSDSGVVYVIDTYTPRADQRVLTAAAVFEKRQALCIESSLVMASALLSAGMHPMLIITPTHAQVAVETWAGSGQYFLIETSALPYGGLDRGMDSGNSWAWGGLTPVYDDGGSIAWVESGGSSDTWVRYFNMVEDFDSDTYGGIFVIDCNLQRILGITGLEAM